MAGRAGRVALVTDSTAYLPTALIAAHGLSVVPVEVIVGGVARDEREVEAADIVAALRDGQTVTTSRPSPAAFAQTYERLADEGATEIVSAHLSAELSGTVDSARLAATDAPVPVHVVDSRAIAMALGFGVLAGARAASRNSSGEQVAQAVTDCCAGTRTFIYVDTLEYLRRGGRIGPAAARLGSALAVKPLLHLADGTLAPLEKVRTASRGLARLEELAVTCAGERRVDVAVQHLAAAARAAAVADQLHERIPGLVDLVVDEVGAVVGTHVGPGLVAVAVSPREP